MTVTMLFCSGLARGPCSMSSEVRRDTGNGLSSLRGQYKLALTEHAAALALVPSDSLPEPSWS